MASVWNLPGSSRQPQFVLHEHLQRVALMARWIIRKGTRNSGFRYVRHDGRSVTAAVRERIAKLGIPPAWREVHIAASPRAAIQAWGYDARGRRQYRYHPRAVVRRELRKHYRVRQLARDLPRLRARLERESRRRGNSRDKVAALVVRLIGEGFFRVGTDRYARENRTFGITTLRKSHVEVRRGVVVFAYRGKLSRQQRHVVVSPDLARLTRQMLRTPGARLFRYQTATGWRDLTSRDVNEYLEAVAGFPYTAKDLRTWGGTLRAATVLAELGTPASDREARKNALTAVRLVAAELGNTPAICRSSYVHPEVLQRYIEARETIRVRSSRAQSLPGHSPEERALITFLDEHFPERRKKRRAG
jgi:DNA topoisomerase I